MKGEGARSQGIQAFSKQKPGTAQRLSEQDAQTSTSAPSYAEAAHFTPCHPSHAAKTGRPQAQPARSLSVLLGASHNLPGEFGARSTHSVKQAQTRIPPIAYFPLAPESPLLSHSQMRGSSRLGLLLLLSLFSVTFYRTAWVSDDAFISFRVIDNFLNGHGLVWNVNERVQAFTHPLWLFLLSCGVYFTQDPYWTSLLLSFLCSLGALWFSWRALSASVPPLALVCGLGLLFLSRAWVDYSSSGLENPLQHLLLVLFLMLGDTSGSKRPLFHKAGILVFLTSLLFLTRPDAIVLPLLLSRLWQWGKRASIRAASGDRAGAEPPRPRRKARCADELGKRI